MSDEFFKSLNSVVNQLGFVLIRKDTLGDSIDKEGVQSFINAFRNNYVSVDLIRVGGNADGGYLIPDIRAQLSHVFSPGVSDIANFENELSVSHGIKCFLADASVESPPLMNENFDFTKKFLGSYCDDVYITLSEWMRCSLKGTESELLLQMDIEGGEYDVLVYESLETLSRFGVMVIEFHGWQRLFQKSFSRMVRGIFEKIYPAFSICHVHPNNCCGIASVDNINIPRVLEITFIRKDLIPDYASSKSVVLPHSLDKANIPSKEDLIMPHEWWRRP
jgi:hypothetical protein